MNKVPENAKKMVYSIICLSICILSSIFAIFIVTKNISNAPIRLLSLFVLACFIFSIAIIIYDNYDPK